MAAQPAPDPLAAAAQEFATVIAAEDVEALDAWWDGDAFLDRVLADMALEPAFEAGVRSEIARRGPFHPLIAEAVANGGSYHFLRLVERDGETRARFRLLSPDGGLNYTDLVLEARPGGGGRLVDGYGFLGGEDVSQSLRRVLLGMLGGADGTTEPSGRARLIGEFAQALGRGDWWTVLDLYPRIPPRDLDRKPLLIAYLQAASNADPALYRKGLEQFARAYAGDPDAALVLIDHYVLRGDVEATLEAIDTLDEGVGGDPYLDQLRATVLLGAGRLPEARAAADRLAESLPNLTEAQFPRVDVALAEGDFAAVAEGLLRLEREHGAWFDPAAVKADPLWAGFAASPYYKRWATARAD